MIRLQGNLLRLFLFWCPLAGLLGYVGYKAYDYALWCLR